jgi:hypothetical protein
MTSATTFNTGRHYGPKGQPITAAIREDRTVIFHDHARGIHGVLTIGRGRFDALQVDPGEYPEWALRGIVMAAYDDMAYRYDSEAGLLTYQS